MGTVCCAAIALVGVMCAAPAVAGDRLPADPVVSEWPDWPFRAGCRNMTLDPGEVFGEAPALGRGRGSIDRALRQTLKLLGMRDQHAPWRLGRRAHGRVALLRGHPGAELESGEELEYVELKRRKRSWQWTGTYDQLCYLRTVDKGRWADSWFLAPDQPPLGPETQAVRVVAGVHCSATEKPPVLDGEPKFTEIGGKLAMTLWLRRRGSSGIVLCDGSLPDWPPLEIQLPAPLGDRELFDGSEYPPNPAAHLERTGPVPLRSAIELR